MSRSPEQINELIKELKEENLRRDRNQLEERKLYLEQQQQERAFAREQLILERELARSEAVDRETRVFLTSANVRPYTGDKNPSKIHEFKNEIERISEGFNLSNRQLITVAGRNMKGKAENWFNQYIKDEVNLTSTFDQFILALEVYFGEGYDVQWHHSQLFDLVQNGSVKNFNYRYDKLLENLPTGYLPEDVKINTYLTQLKPKIRREVKCKKPDTLREAQRLAMIYDDQYNRDTRLFLTSATVKTYTGSKVSTKIQYFLDEIIRISNGFILTDEQMIIVAGRNMSGIAEKWYLAYQEEKLHQSDTFEEFGERLKNQFGQAYDVQVSQAKLIACVQSGKVEDYNRRFYDILNEFPKDYFSEQAKVANYLCNLTTELRCEVKIKDPVNLGDAMKYAGIIEGKYTGKANWEKKFIKRPIRGFRPKDNDDMEIDNVSTNKPKAIGRKCYECDKEGHFAANCPDKLKN